MIEAWVAGVSVQAPGLAGWAASRAVLAGRAPYAELPLNVPPPVLLSATERRRTGQATRLALAAAHEAVIASGLRPSEVRPVFGSGNGDGITVSAILEALCQPGGQVSPTQFHNSVHNAAAGYWSIGAGSAEPALCLGCFDSTWPATLLAAMSELRASRTPVLLVAYDVPLPPPLSAVRPTAHPFAVGLVLSPAPIGPRLAVGYVACRGESRPDDPALHGLFDGNPAARSIPVLAALARGGPAAIAAAYLDGRLDIEVG